MKADQITYALFSKSTWVMW